MYKHSKFGIHSCISPSCPVKTKEFPVIYRDLLYFFPSGQEREAFCERPFHLSRSESMPMNINYCSKLFVLGRPKCGKTTLCKR